ncbi:hypothetical protein [Plantibacter sp. YIM 135347]|uniref:DUF4190 domain-containing protein n=1 Tax=Plantibacter sp. YIM 135347 TaxID=3423919 RepID=UPI003D32DB21
MSNPDQDSAGAQVSQGIPTPDQPNAPTPPSSPPTTPPPPLAPPTPPSSPTPETAPQPHIPAGQQVPSAPQQVQSYQQPPVQPGYPQQFSAQPGYQQGGYVQPGYPQAGYAQPAYQQAGYGQAGYGQPMAQPGVQLAAQQPYGQAGYPQAAYQQAGYPQQPTFVQATPVYFAPSEPKGLSLSSMVIGLVSLFLGFTFVLPLVGLVLGILGAKREPAGRGMAVTGIILNGLFILGWTLLVVFWVLLVGGIAVGTATTGYSSYS